MWMVHRFIGTTIRVLYRMGTRALLQYCSNSQAGTFILHSEYIPIFFTCSDSTCKIAAADIPSSQYLTNRASDWHSEDPDSNPGWISINHLCKYKRSTLIL